MLRSLLSTLAVALLIAGCATTPMVASSAAQNIYQAHGYYNVALGGAVAYAESPIANGAVVAQMNTINKKVRPAFVYSEAVVACAGDSRSADLIVIAANVKCAGLDLSPENISHNANLLRGAAKKLFGFLGRGG